MIDAYPVLRRDYPLNEKNLDWWVNEQESPYTEVKRFDWYRGYHLGGRSLTWGRQSYRLSDLDFEANAERRHRDRLAGPLRRHRAVVRSRRDVTPAFPDRSKGCRNCPTASSIRRCRSTARKRRWPARVAKKFSDRRIIPGRVANLTQPLPGRGRCQYRNACALGCPFGALLQHAVVDAAGRDGDRPVDAEDLRDRHRRGLRRDRKRATGVRVIDAVTNATTEYSAKVVFLCASTLNSTWLLMRSARDVWPGGLGSSSGELGHNLMDHHFRCGASGILRRAQRQDRLRPAAERLLHSALPESVRRQARVPARLRLPGQREPARLAARGRGARRRRRLQGCDGDAGAVADRRHRASAKCCRITPTAITIDESKKRQVGPAGPVDRLRDRRERTADAPRHDERHGRDARSEPASRTCASTTTAPSPAWASTRWAPRAWDAIRRPRC